MKLAKRLLLPGLTIVAAAGLLTACSNDYDHCHSCDRNSSYYEESHGKHVDFMGTVYYDRSEGGHYMIKADNGRRYHPVDTLPHRFRKDGMHVHVVGVKRGKVMEGRACALEVKNIDRA